MEIPDYQPFYIDSVETLRAEIARLGLDVPVNDDVSALGESMVIGHQTFPNRFCAQPIAGNDAGPDGAPGELTRLRYRRYAEGGFGLVWMERTAAGAIGNPRQPCLHDKTVSAFRSMIEEMRTGLPVNPVIIVQLVSDDLAAIRRAASLAFEVGFDGLDLQCPRDLLPRAVAEVREHAPELLVATRLCAYEAVRGGFGVAPRDYRQHDLQEPIRLARELRERGLALLNITASSPILAGADRGTRARPDSERPDEHPLMTLRRQLTLARAMREAVPGLPVVGSGFSWLRQFVSNVAAGAVREGMIDFAGLGRGALAHPYLPAESLAFGRIEPGATCMVCFACSRLQEAGESVGCVIRNPDECGPVYQRMRDLDADQLLAGAHRCHLCEAAPCVAASPTRTNIPAFIHAFRSGDEDRAYEIIRASDPLPELTTQYAPAWMESEGACIETTLTGSPVPILDLQYAIAWRVRDRGRTGVRLPAKVTSRKVAIIGGGPAGVAAAIRLLERGHAVDLYERSSRLGGVPERLLARHRNLPGPHLEIEAALAPALAEARLHVHYGATLGGNLSLEQVRATHDAVVLATGLWKDRSIGQARGVVGALEFLEMTDPVVPARVAILAGGDAAMDAARVVQSRGAEEIFVIFGGPRSALHWHMSDDWFATPGVHAMMNWLPFRYEKFRGGRLRGVRLLHSKPRVELVLRVDLVVEAMGLAIPDEALSIIHSREDVVESRPEGQPGKSRVYAAGAVVNGGASVTRCVADGLAVAETIDRDLTK